jgi:putative ABC transport system permease protein
MPDLSRILLICRLAATDRGGLVAEVPLFLLAVVAAAATLTIALSLHGVPSQPYQQTQTAGAGPNVAVSALCSPQVNSIMHTTGVR